MPIYEYHCESCGEFFELLIRGEERPECPHCHGTKLKKEFSVVAAHSRSSSNACELPACQEGACGMPTGGCGLGECGL